MQYIRQCQYMHVITWHFAVGVFRRIWSPTATENVVYALSVCVCLLQGRRWGLHCRPSIAPPALSFDSVRQRWSDCRRIHLTVRSAKSSHKTGWANENSVLCPYAKQTNVTAYTLQRTLQLHYRFRKVNVDLYSNNLVSKVLRYITCSIPLRRRRQPPRRNYMSRAAPPPNF